MNRTLEMAVAEAATLPDNVQTDLGNRPLRAVSRNCSVDAEPAKGEQSLRDGGSFPAERLFDELRRRYSG